MTSEANAGRIQVSDIEELNYSVWPWDLRMQQMSRGEFRAELDFAQVNGVLLTHERWLRRVSASGATPPGYLALSGICTSKSYTSCGVPIDTHRVLTALNTTEIDFDTPDDEEHWVMLVPIGLMIEHLGDELAKDLLPRERSVASDPGVIRQLANLVVRVVAKLRENRSYRANDLLLNAIQSQLLGTVTELLVESDRYTDQETPRKRFLACRRALRHVHELKHPISVNELAAQVGASRRSLELGFRETLDISPQRYLRYMRLNGLHRDLRRALSGQTTVTEAVTHWGFSELGRTAVQYRELFGESPSTTLARSGRLDCRQYADVMTFSSNAKRSDHVEGSGRGP